MKVLSWLLLLLGSSFSIIAQPSPWKLAKTDGNIEVFTRKIPGETLKEFKVEMFLSVSADQVLDILKDVPSNSIWMDRCQSSRLLEPMKGQKMILYNDIKSPWPATDRDMVIEFRITRKGDATICKLVGLPDYLPKAKDRVRIPRYKGEWRLEPQLNGKLKITSQALVSPGGSVPDWLANSAVVDGPLATMKNLKKLLGK